MGQDQTINIRAIECRISCYNAKEAAKKEALGMDEEDDEEDIWADCVFDMTRAVFVKPRDLDDLQYSAIIFDHDSILTDIPFPIAKQLFIQSRYTPPKNPLPL